ncbi:hypothetical protein [Candidatus Chloroploca asiatica]|uniref:hypothetical protein n=1 Tax=Candidatus Chloroploca asiatica TaxID=1506545 RepID=UPI0011418908|nr:hypothetical protein [Candidatus Chloroploca asiatica]
MFAPGANAKRLIVLSNDQRAVRYGQAKGIEVVDRPAILRLFWTQQIITPADVAAIITRMAQVERLTASTETVAFLTLRGETVAVMTVPAAQIRPIGINAIAHVQALAAA